MSTPPAAVVPDRGAPDPVVDDARRVVPLDAVHNFRDLGGYRTDDGRQIAWGRLFRADGLYRLTADDLGVVDALGIRTVIDLRSSAEFDQHGHFPLERYPVAFHHLSIIDTTWMAAETPDVDDTDAGAVEFLTWAYGDLLAQGADRFAHAIQLLAMPGAMPAVFHCAAGKDRTGVLAALVLGTLGVDADTIVADYALTEAAMVRMRAWVREHHPEMDQRMGETPSFMLAAKPEAMRNVLDGLRARYGSVRGYLSAIGVGHSVVDDLSAALTVDS